MAAEIFKSFTQLLYQRARRPTNSILWMAMFVTIAGVSWAQPPVPISPAVDDGASIVVSGCPTFSWSEVADAVSYRLAVFEPGNTEGKLNYEDMALLKSPTLEQAISDRGYSWTPSADSCLPGGDYLWFVAAVDPEDAHEWSEGKIFKVNALTGLGEDSEETSDGGAMQESESPASTGKDEPDALSLEQIISSTVSREQLLTPKENSGQVVVSMGAEGISYTLYGKSAGESISDENRYATFICAYAGNLNTSGFANTFVGNGSGFSTTTGSHNTFVGSTAGPDNTTGGQNTFVGSFAGRMNKLGSYNTFVGYDAGYSNIDDEDNTFIGQGAGYLNTNGSWNAFLGIGSGRSNTTGGQNTFLGNEAGYNNSTGFSNVFIGNRAGYSEEESNKLYIANTETDTPLIYGEFDNKIVKIHGQLQMVTAAASSDLRLNAEKKQLQDQQSQIDELRKLVEALKG